MLERTESSVLVSLRELGRLEDDRVAREEAARQRKIAEAERMEREAADAARREIELRAAGEAARALAAVQQQRLEAARAAATRDAAVARATVLATSEVELAALRQQQVHELRLAEIANAGAARHWKFVQMGFVAMVVASTVGAGWFVHRERERRTAASESAERALHEREGAVAAAKAALDKRQAALDELDAKRKLAAAERTNAPVSPASPSPGGAIATKNAPGGPKPSKQGSPGVSGGCLPMDPLCGDLVR